MESRNKKIRKICIVTGSRAEYGLLKPIMVAINNHSHLDLSLIVTGTHLSEEFGYSVDEIIKDGFNCLTKVYINPSEDTGFSMAESFGIGAKEIAKVLKDIHPDILLVLGDRVETLASVISAAYMNIPIAHIHGGDSAKAGIDESARHAITKFANIHFPATKKSAERILKMGERKDRIFITGAPCLDTIFSMDYLSKENVSKKFRLDLKNPFILMVQHSVTTEPEKAEEHIIESLEAVKHLKYQTIIIYPNSDSGGRRIINQIKKYEHLHFIRTYKNLSQRDYLSLLNYASVMIGNSSSGIIESPSFRLPVVNIGIRQEGRERSENIINSMPEREDIISSIAKALSLNFKNKLKDSKNPYGDGKTGEKIAKILSEIDLNNALIQKKITY
ncbi:UDP-N-acetylglucosamine 2-epimerase (hydrolyzing) [Candidatus Woesearchaeota archaeon]|nr:UDP-N-acetylglucosamine 2-epimerase (hydrolyzing) [Candidatus Woesearchaeota archaeon]